MHSPETIGHTTGHFLGHLVLTGHTHAGQLRIPGFGALYTSTPYGKQFESGWYRRPSDGTWMMVTAGIGQTVDFPLSLSFPAVSGSVTV